MYVMITPEKQAAIAFLHESKCVINQFLTELGKEIKESSVSTWKKSSAELKHACSKRVSKEQGEEGPKLLHIEELDTAIKNYIKAVCYADGVINIFHHDPCCHCHIVHRNPV